MDFILYVLYIEIIFFSFFISPIPFQWKKCIFIFIIKSNLFQKGKYIFAVLYGIIFLQFIEFIVIFNSNEYKETQKHPSFFMEPHTYLRFPYFQKNMYLTGFTLLLALIWNRFLTLLGDVFHKEENMEILKKQCLRQQEQMLKIVEENKQKDEKIIELQETITKAEKDVKNCEVIKKQAENQQKEYFKLLDDFNQLEEKVKFENKKDK